MDFLEIKFGTENHRLVPLGGGNVVAMQTDGDHAAVPHSALHHLSQRGGVQKQKASRLQLHAYTG